LRRLKFHADKITAALSAAMPSIAAMAPATAAGSAFWAHPSET